MLPSALSMMACVAGIMLLISVALYSSASRSNACRLV